MRESDVEKYLHKRVTDLGGTTRKWTSPGHAGVPDRIVLFPDGDIHFVEVKTLTGKLSTRQQREIDFLRSFGFQVHVVKGRTGVDIFIARVKHAHS